MEFAHSPTSLQTQIFRVMEIYAKFDYVKPVQQMTVQGNSAARCC